MLRRLWPRRLAGQLIALLLLALVLAQAASFLIFADERWAALRTAERKHILARTASIVRLIESTPPALHEQIVRTASSRQLRFWLERRRARSPPPTPTATAGCASASSACSRTARRARC